MNAGAVERAPAPEPAAAEPPRAEAEPRPARAPDGPPAVRLLPATPAPPANVPAEVGAVLRSPGPGEPLPTAVGAPIGASLGVDVSPVRLHADERAAGAAEAVSARAFTYGTHVYLGRGEGATDLPLVAHEVAHAVQQQGSPAVQLFGGGPDPGPLEHEARRASAAVARGASAAVLGRTTPAVQRQFGWVRRAAGAVAGAVRTAASAVAEGASGLLARAINYVKERARSIPGYDLVAFALGRDPITQEPVPRNAMNLIRAVVGLIPGGAAILQHLQQSGALQRAFEWATGELERLGLTWTRIRGAVSAFIDSLGPGDLVNLGGVFDRARRLFGPLLAGAVRFASAAGRKLLEFVFEAVMAAAGGQRILGIFRRIGETFQLIVSDPVRFIGNLVNAVKGGFQRFAANIIGHLRTALFEWLLGALRGVLTLPSRWDLAGIVSVVLQILGLTYQALRQRLVRLIGERAVGYIETAFDFIRTIVTRGLAAAWDKIVEFASGLVDTVVEGIRNWVARSIVGAAVTRLVTMFNPVGAIIQSIIAIYNTIMFFVERAQQIGALLGAIVDSISSIARGNIGAAVAYVERTMARFLPVLISFLARLIGLGNISGTIREIIGRIRGVVDRAVDRIVQWVVARVRGLIDRLTGRSAPPPSRETPESGDVRTAVRQEVTGRVVANAEQGNRLLQTTLDRLRPRGLKGIALRVNPQRPNAYEVVANASVTAVVAEVRRETQLQTLAKRLSPYSSRTTLFVFYGASGRQLPGTPIGNRDRHAETRFFLGTEGYAERLLAAVRGLPASEKLPNGRVPVLLQLNRTPCDGCADVIASFARRHEDLVAIRLEAASVYQADWQSIQQTSVSAAIGLADAKVELAPLRIWDAVVRKMRELGVQEVQTGPRGMWYGPNQFGDLYAQEAAVQNLVNDAIAEARRSGRIQSRGEGVG